MVVRSVSLAAFVAFAVAWTAVASSPSISAAPNPVHRGQSVRIFGNVPGCPRGDRVTLISAAFSHRYDFAGMPAVFASIGPRHGYSVRTTIPAVRKPGRYTVTGRCAGGNLGVSATLHVVR